MTEQEFQTIYPLVFDWIRRTLTEHRPIARSAASYGFKRLPLYFRRETLLNTKVVEVPQVPVPPLTAMGLTQFQDFEQRGASGIT